MAQKGDVLETKTTKSSEVVQIKVSSVSGRYDLCVAGVIKKQSADYGHIKEEFNKYK